MALGPSFAQGLAQGLQQGLIASMDRTVQVANIQAQNELRKEVFKANQENQKLRNSLMIRRDIRNTTSMLDEEKRRLSALESAGPRLGGSITPELNLQRGRVRDLQLDLDSLNDMLGGTVEPRVTPPGGQVSVPPPTPIKSQPKVEIEPKAGEVDLRQTFVDSPEEVIDQIPVTGELRLRDGTTLEFQENQKSVEPTPGLKIFAAGTGKGRAQSFSPFPKGSAESEAFLQQGQSGIDNIVRAQIFESFGRKLPKSIRNKLIEESDADGTISTQSIIRHTVDSFENSAKFRKNFEAVLKNLERQGDFNKIDPNGSPSKLIAVSHFLENLLAESDPDFVDLPGLDIVSFNDEKRLSDMRDFLQDSKNAIDSVINKLPEAIAPDFEGKIDIRKLLKESGVDQPPRGRSIERARKRLQGIEAPSVAP